MYIVLHFREAEIILTTSSIILAVKSSELCYILDSVKQILVNDASWLHCYLKANPSELLDFRLIDQNFDTSAEMSNIASHAENRRLTSAKNVSI